jgi:hypothetical protein
MNSANDADDPFETLAKGELPWVGVTVLPLCGADGDGFRSGVLVMAMMMRRGSRRGRCVAQFDWLAVRRVEVGFRQWSRAPLAIVGSRQRWNSPRVVLDGS